MAARYFTRPTARIRFDGGGLADDAPMIASIDVPEHEATATGVLDANGGMVMRAPRPVGFYRDGDW